MLLAALGVDNFGSGLFLPLAILYTTRVVGLPLSVAGVVVSAGTLVGLLVPPLAGRLVDRVGPRPVVITAQLLQAAGATTYLFADGVALTLLAALLLAAGQQTFYSSLFALIADVAEPGPRDRSFAVVAMVRSATFGLGALVAGVVLIDAGSVGLRAAVAIDALSFLVAAAGLAVFVRARHHSADRAPGDSSEHLGGVLSNRPYLALITVTGLVALTTDVFLIGLPVYVLDQLDGPTWLPGVVLAMLTVITSTSAAAVVRATERLSRTTTMAMGAATYCAWSLSVIAAAFLPPQVRTAWILAATLVLAAASLLFGARTNALAEAAAPRASRGRHLAAFQYAFTVAGVLAPAVVSLFSVAIWLPWALVAACAALAALALPRLGALAPSGARSQPAPDGAVGSQACQA